MKIAGVGDLICTRPVLNAMSASDPDLLNTLRETDLTIGNMEFVVPGINAVPAPYHQGIHLAAEAGSVGDLKKAGFDLVSVANNHATDFWAASGWGPDRLSNHTGVPRTTCWRIINRNDTGPRPRTKVGPHGSGKGRYEAIGCGELVHVDVTKLARIPSGGGHRMVGRQTGKANRRADPDSGGYDYLHAAVDDHSRLAYAQLLDGEDGETCAGFWRRAATFFAANGIDVKRIMTDNALAYTRSHAFAQALDDTDVDDHWTIEAYRPQTNGKVERFNRTIADEWAYAYFWTDNRTRHDAFPTWLHWYNHHRDHTSLQRRPPMARVNNAAVCDN